MSIVMMVALALAAQDVSFCHVRSSDPQVTMLIHAGLEQSATFRRLVDALDRSDVVVYVNPQIRRQGLGGYLAHNVLNGGGYRYLHVSIALRGTSARAISVLAHELQHALEVAEHSDARDANSVQQLFVRLSIGQACGVGNCFETQAAQDVELAVLAEVVSARR